MQFHAPKANATSQFKPPAKMQNPGMFEIRATKTRATCGGLYGCCETYKNHPDWPNLVAQGRHIPKNELAVFVSASPRGFCVCKTHAKQLFAHMKEILELAKELDWID